MPTPTLRIILVAENVDEQELNLFHETLAVVMMASKLSHDIVQSKGETMTELHHEVSMLSDGYHSFKELYEHRHALFIALLSQAASQNEDAWFSKLHDDGTGYPGWIIAGCYVDVPVDSNCTELERMQIRYHLPDSYIPHLKAAGCMELDKAVPYDGSNPNDTIERLLMAYGSYDTLLAEKKEEASKHIAKIPLPFKSIGG